MGQHIEHGQRKLQQGSESQIEVQWERYASHNAYHTEVQRYMGYFCQYFRLEGPEIGKKVTKFLEMISRPLYEGLVERNTFSFSFGNLLRDGKMFKDFPAAICLTDVTFQQANRLRGNMQERKVYFCSKHRLYSYKVEVSNSPTDFL